MNTEVDFSDDLLNGGFKFNNPQTERECGCGISFSM
jgi:iron-sulfur cluster assembly protein